MMPWGRLDDSMVNHPKFLGLDPAAIGLWTMGNAYCADQLTDGFIPRDQVPKLVAVSPARAFALARLLVDAKGRSKCGLWEDVDGGYQVHDYLDWNPSAEKVRHDRAAARARQERHRERKTGRFGQASDNGRVTPDVTRDVTRDESVSHGVSHGVSHARPIPSHYPPIVPPAGGPGASHEEASEIGPREFKSYWFKECGCVKPEYWLMVEEHHRRPCKHGD